MEEFFNFDSFDNQDEDTGFNDAVEEKIGEIKEAFEEFKDDSPKKKRSREDDDNDTPIEKKKKIIGLAEELEILAKQHPFTFKLNDTPIDGVNISCSVNSHSFTLSIHNRNDYENSSSTITFTTTQKPDSLSPLIAKQLLPGSKSRITDILTILLEHLKDA
jgi:hypothetical protein